MGAGAIQVRPAGRRSAVDPVNITIDTKGLTAFLDDFQQRQVPFALSNTLNDVGALFQYREREHIAQVMNVRRKDWVDKNVKITHFAKKTELYTSVEIQSPGGGDRSDILAKFEQNTSKSPTSGSAIAVPVDAKRNKAGIAPRLKSFHFKEVHGPKHVAPLKARIRSGILRGALQVFEGDKKTVMIKNAKGQGVILQRVGRGKRAGMRTLFYLTPRVKLTPNLQFLAHAQEAATHAAAFFRARFAEAMSTAKR